MKSASLSSLNSVSTTFFQFRMSCKALIRHVAELLYRRLDHRFEGSEDLVDLTFDMHSLRQQIKNLVIHSGKQGRFAPHVYTIRVPYSTERRNSHEKLMTLKNAVHARVIDYLNDRFYNTFEPVRVQMITDIYTPVIVVEPSFGRLDKQAQMQRKRSNLLVTKISAESIVYRVRVSWPGFTSMEDLTFVAGGDSLSVGRSEGNDLVLNHPSVAQRQATLAVTREGTLQIADLDSLTNTLVNDHAVPNGQTRNVRENDVVSFGKAKVRFRKHSPLNP